GPRVRALLGHVDETVAHADVAVRMRPADQRVVVHRDVGVAQVERTYDPGPHLVRVRVAADLLDEETGDGVVDAVVPLRSARAVHHGIVRRGGDDLPRRLVLEAVANPPARVRRAGVVLRVRQPAGVIEQLPYGDPRVALRQQPRQV